MTVQSGAFGKVLVASVLALGIGFVVGREEMKYELRTAFQDAARSFAGIFGGGPPQPNPKPASYTPKEPSPVTVTLKDKGFIEKDFHASRYESYQTFTIAIQNTGTKNIRAFNGSLQFYDLLDSPVYAVNLTIDDPVSAGGTLTWKGQSEFNQFIERQVRFKDMPLTNLKTSFVPKKVLFADGTSSNFD